MDQMMSMIQTYNQRLMVGQTLLDFEIKLYMQACVTLRSLLAYQDFKARQEYYREKERDADGTGETGSSEDSNISEP